MMERHKAKLETFNVILDIIFKLVVGAGTAFVICILIFSDEDIIKRNLIHDASLYATTSHYDEDYRSNGGISGQHSGWFSADKARVDHNDPKPDHCWQPDFVQLYHKYLQYNDTQPEKGMKVFHRSTSYFVHVSVSCFFL
jgi:hypothetical protein